MTNLNKLRSAMIRDHEQGQQIEDEERYQREKEREEAEWQEYLDAEKEKEQLTKMKTFELTFKITVANEVYESLVKEYGEDGIEEVAKKHMSEMGVEGVGDIELIGIRIT